MCPCCRKAQQARAIAWVAIAWALAITAAGVWYASQPAYPCDVRHPVLQQEPLRMPRRGVDGLGTARAVVEREATDPQEPKR